MPEGPSRFWHFLAVASILLLSGLAACSGGGGDAAQPIETSSTTTAPTSSTTSTTSTTTTQPVPTGPIAPLTGLVEPVTDLDRPALVLKIDNHPEAGAQIGLDQADLVMEIRAEGVTRFMAVFHSQTPSEVGPVRSSRTSDFDLLTALDTPLYGSSGGNQVVMRGLRGLPIIAVTALSEQVYYRDPSRPAPHDMMVDPADLFAMAPDDATPPEPWFTYREPGASLPATAVAADGPIEVNFRNSPLVTLTWSPTAGGWSRRENGEPHLMSDGTPIAPENVVIMVTRYVASSADRSSPELVSVGSGDLYVLTDGAVIEGTWTRENPDDKPTLLDSRGAPILLTPGRTWIEYPEKGSVVVP